MGLSEDLLLRIHRDMVRTRTLDYQMIKNSRSGKMSTGWHSGLGQEAIVGPVALLSKNDYVTYTHRGAYVWIAKGMGMKEIVAEDGGGSSGDRSAVDGEVLKGRVSRERSSLGYDRRRTLAG